MMLRTLVHHMMVWISAWGAGNDPATVTELRVEPVADYTEVVIITSDEVAYSDFLLTPSKGDGTSSSKGKIGRTQFSNGSDRRLALVDPGTSMGTIKLAIDSYHVLNPFGDFTTTRS